MHVFLTLASIAFSVPALIYSMHVHIGHVFPFFVARLAYRLLFLLSVPWAVARPTATLRFVSAVSFYLYLLSCYVSCHLYGLLEVLDADTPFGSLPAMFGSGASANVICLFFIARALGEEHLTRSYATYEHVLGFHGVYIWGLVLPSKWLHWGPGAGVGLDRSFVVIQLYVAGILVGGLCASSSKGLRCVARFYLVCFCCIKFLEMCEVFHWDVWVLVLFSVGVGLSTAIYLKGHRGFVVAVLTGK
eukprot:m51a1_g13388 hypothetical protein (246) ;mRNA; r:1644-2381